MQQQIFEAELESVEANLDVLRSQGKEVSRRMLRGLEIRKQNLEVKLDNLADTIKNRTDDVVDFKMMGIDHLLVDEFVQKFNIYHPSRPCGRAWKPRRKPAGTQYALCCTDHSGT